jgi:glycosyltransferase involved in cell wall biosynthesis
MRLLAMTITDNNTTTVSAVAECKPMRVLLLTDSDVFAGTERHILEVAEGLRACGVDVMVGCPEPSVLGARARDLGLPVVVIQKGGIIDVPAIRMLQRLLADGQIDLVHAHNGRTGFSAAIATTFAASGASVVTQHFIEPGRLRQGFAQRIVRSAAHRWTNSRITRFIAISGAVREEMIARGDAGAERIAIVPNGISAPQRDGTLDSAGMRSEFGIEASSPLVVCVARLEVEKDLPTLVAAMGKVIAQEPKARCVIVGEGAGRAALGAQIAQAELQDKVILAGFQRDSIRFIQAADLFVLPSVAEPFGLVILEAMALGKPVIATAAGGPREIVVHGETGLLVEPSHPEEMAGAILRLIRDPVALGRMGEKGRARFEHRYTTERMAQATLGVYEEALRAIRQ